MSECMSPGTVLIINQGHLKQNETKIKYKSTAKPYISPACYQIFVDLLINYTKIELKMYTHGGSGR